MIASILSISLFLLLGLGVAAWLAARAQRRSREGELRSGLSAEGRRYLQRHGRIWP